MDVILNAAFQIDLLCSDISRANKENTKVSAETRLKIKEVSD